VNSKSSLKLVVLIVGAVEMTLESGWWEWPQWWPIGCGAGDRARCHAAVKQWPDSLASSVSHVFSLSERRAYSLALSMFCTC